MTRGPSLRSFAWVIVACVSAGCAPTPQTIPFRSLESTGTAAFVCFSIREGDAKFSGERYIKDCPDTNPVDGEFRRTFALVTQPTRGEVAVMALNVVDTAGGKQIGGAVVDEEPAVPGFNFLPVGARPVDIVASPGSAAAFVAAAEVGKEGIYALPSSCVLRRDADATGPDGAAEPQPVRDISLWPACHLESPPGKMTVLIDETRMPDGSYRKSCAGPTPTASDAGAADAGDAGAAKPGENAAGPPLDLETEAAQAGRSCEARVYDEQGPPGRRKLLVSLPDLGEFVLIDAQELLDRPQGSFGACTIEARWKLKGMITPVEPIVQKLPQDLSAIFPGGRVYPPPPEEGYTPRPAGLARLDDSNEHKLFVADSSAPMIHRLDTSDPCNIAELPPLLPVSYFEGGRTITTTKVAVMDRLTRDGKRFLYAIDQLGGGQVMIFDVSPGSADRTPIVRERSPFIPFEAPDRLALSAPAVDVGFITREGAPSPERATGTQGLEVCDPTPGADGPGTLFRPTLPDYSSGARPMELRGTFGLVAMSNGVLAVVDVEDLDQACRRPKEPNRGTTEDFRGCPPDHTDSSFTKDGLVSSPPTVTDEVSCQVVERHRARSANLALTDSSLGPRAPSVRVAPRLVDKDGRGLLVDSTDAGRKHPKMLGVNFRNFDGAHPENRARVFIGTELWTAPLNADDDHQLVIDPAKATQNSVVLSLAEPRAYTGGVEDLTVTYEGKLLNRPAGVIRIEDLVPGNGQDEFQLTLRDSSVSFCGAGVESTMLASRRAQLKEKKDLGAENQALFAEEYADYVVITGNLLPETDAYWQRGSETEPNRGATCHGANPDQPSAGFIQCRVLFGTPEALNDQRNFTIEDATRDTLTLRPRDVLGETAKQERIKDLACCFPEPVSYTIRVSKQWLVSGAQVSHNVVAASAAPFRCVPDLNPFFSQFQMRAYEVSCDEANSPACLELDPKGEHPPRAIIGPNVYPDTQLPPERTVARACIVRDPTTDMQTIEAALHSGCIYTTNQSNFVIYRGTEPSEQDMHFQWQIVGGFTPQIINLSLINDANTSPQSILRSPFDGTVIVADGGNKGLVIVDLTSFAPYPIN